jgi:hypothetical protein
MNFINPTIVIFNNRLKAFIEKIKDNIDISRLSYLNYINLIFNDIFECQKEIRNFISSNKNCFDTINYKKKLSKGDMYAIIILILIDDLNEEKYKTFEDVFNELIRINKSNYEDDIKNIQTSIEYENDSKCFCGKDCYILNMYYITNNKNNLILITGCDCICKTGIETKDKLLKNNYERKLTYFKSKNDISDIEYAGGNKGIDAKYHAKYYDTITELICCDVCTVKKPKIKKRKQKEDDDEEEDENEDKKIEKKYYYFFDNIGNEGFIFCKKCSESLELTGKYGACQFCKKPNNDNKGIYCLSCKTKNDEEERQVREQKEQERKRIKEEEEEKERLKPKPCLICENICVLTAGKCEDCFEKKKCNNCDKIIYDKYTYCYKCYDIKKKKCKCCNKIIEDKYEKCFKCFNNKRV